MRRTNRVVAILAVGLLIGSGATVALADEINWADTVPLSGTVSDDSVTVIGPGTFPLIRLDDVSISGGSFEVSGTVSYEDVTGDAYLEMWVHFGDESYFSRTLADAGPQRVISGTSQERPFVLPFQYGDAAPPTALEINVVLPGTGVVTVGPLVTAASAGDDVTWMSRSDIGIVGAVGGSILGLAGAFVGVAGGRGRARRTVLGVLYGLVGFGAVALLVALIGWVSAQPGWLIGPIALMGALAAGVTLPLIPKIRQTFETRDLHRITALDA